MAESNPSNSWQKKIQRKRCAKSKCAKKNQLAEIPLHGDNSSVADPSAFDDSGFRNKGRIQLFAFSNYLFLMFLSKHFTSKNYVFIKNFSLKGGYGVLSLFG